MTQLRACCLGHPTLYRSCVLASSLVLLIAVIGFVATTQLASAASFDCARAATPREKLICREPELSDLDAQLGRTYQQKRTILSAHGAELLQRSQQSWLHFITVVCPMAVSSNAGRWGSPKTCLKVHYEQRLRELALVGQRIGPYIFNRIDLYEATPASDPADKESGSEPGFRTQHIAYPQIDGADTNAVAAWNGQVKTEFEKACDDDEIEYEVGYASARMISVEWTTSSYCHGTPHGTYAVGAQNTVLLPDPRPLTAKDVFGTGNHWAGKLRQLFLDELRENGKDENETVEAAVAKTVILPDHWLFTSEGLQISFSAYETGCYACNPGPLTVPWSALKPLLSSDAVVP